MKPSEIITERVIDNNKWEDFIDSILQYLDDQYEHEQKIKEYNIKLAQVMFDHKKCDASRPQAVKEECICKIKLPGHAVQVNNLIECLCVKCGDEVKPSEVKTPQQVECEDCHKPVTKGERCVCGYLKTSDGHNYINPILKRIYGETNTIPSPNSVDVEELAKIMHKNHGYYHSWKEEMDCVKEQYLKSAKGLLNAGYSKRQSKEIVELPDKEK